jgi:hypothetical protein
MTDTPASVTALYSEALLRQAPGRRIEMACAMFSFARALALAGERSLRGELDSREERAALLTRFYGEDLADEARARIEAHLRAA